MSELEEKQTILIADDNPDNLKLLKETLNGFGYKVRVATDGKAAVESALSEPPDLILLDIHMPEMDGYEACQKLKSDSRTRHIPVIFVSALSEEFNKLKAFELGGVDYITKPVQAQETKARIAVHLQLQAKLKELEEFNRIMVDREMRLIELKKEVNELAVGQGKEAPYPEVWEEKP